MTDSKSKGPRRPKRRRSTVRIGGTSQSAFAGYAPEAASGRAKASSGKNPETGKSQDGCASEKKDGCVSDAKADEGREDKSEN